MTREHNATAAHLDLTASAARFDRGPSLHIGATFDKPARCAARVNRPPRFVAVLLSLLGINI